MAVQDDGSRTVRPALSELRRFGATNIRPVFRGSYVLVGTRLKGSRKPYWVKQVQKPRRKGPSVLRVTARISVPNPSNCI